MTSWQRTALSSFCCTADGSLFLLILGLFVPTDRTNLAPQTYSSPQKILQTGALTKATWGCGQRKTPLCTLEAGRMNLFLEEGARIPKEHLHGVSLHFEENRGEYSYLHHACSSFAIYDFQGKCAFFPTVTVERFSNGLPDDSSSQTWIFDHATANFSQEVTISSPHCRAIQRVDLPLSP